MQRRPPKRPHRASVPEKHKPSSAPKPRKFSLTPVQRVQIEIIDWKRCSVRALLIIAYITLIHLIAYLCILSYSYTLINKSVWLKSAFYGFFLDLGLYFFGSGAALKAITYVWRPIKFSLGIISIILGIILNVSLYFIGTYSSNAYKGTILPVNVTDAFCKNTKGNEDAQNLCNEKRPVEIGLTAIPCVLPPVSFICVICASISAYIGVYKTPRKVSGKQVDAVWLEPYETYDFYVGRSIPKVPGHHHDHHVDDNPYEHMAEFFEENDDVETLATSLDDGGDENVETLEKVE